MVNNYYETLGVGKEATNEELKIAYRKGAMKWHPDRNNNSIQAEEEFKKIKLAYETLIDPYKRKEHDWKISNNTTQNKFNSRSSSFNNFEFDQAFNSAFEEFFNQTHKSSDKTGRHTEQSTNNKSKSGKVQQRASVKIDFWEAIFGCNKTIKLKLDKNSKQKQTVRINIPQGTEDKDKFVLKIGDDEIKLTVNVQPDKKFTRNNLDLFVNIDIAFTKAALGGEITFQHWTGDISVKIPSGTRGGQAILLPGMGVRKNILTGDLYLIPNITIPNKLTAKQRLLLEEFEDTELLVKNTKDSIFNIWKKYI